MTGEPHPWEIKKTKGDSPVFHIYLNGKYFAQTVDEYKANLIVGAFRYGEVHGSVTSVEKVLDMFFGRLENAAREGVGNQYFVTWADIDCLYGEFKDWLTMLRYTEDYFLNYGGDLKEQVAGDGGNITAEPTKEEIKEYKRLYRNVMDDALSPR